MEENEKRIFDSPAKINLFLRIVQRREDGYHDIETLFQKIDLVDRMEFRFLPESTGVSRNDIFLSIEGAGLENLRLEDNLISRAWRAIREAAGIEIPPVEIILKKHIPTGGGLGGGSSNAATALRAFCECFEPDLPPQRVHAIASQLGADVPFFLESSCAIGKGIGDILEPVHHGSYLWLAMAFPDYGVSTPEVYRAYQPGTDHETGHLKELIHALKMHDTDAVLQNCFNEMEGLAFSIRPELGRLRDRLEALAGRPVRMSGSGSTLYTLCAERDDATAIVEKWREVADLRTGHYRFM